MFRFFIAILALPIWAYEKEGVQQTKLPSSPIQVYESQDDEEVARTKEQDIAPVQQGQQNPPVVIIREQPPIQVYSEPLTPQDKLTRARRQAEEQTENKIKSRLELLRLQDEKARMDKLLSPLEDQHVSVPQQKESAPVQTPKESARKYFIHLGMGHLNHYNRSVYHPDSIERLGASFTAGFGIYEFQKLSLEYTFNFSKHRVAYPPMNHLYNPTHTRFSLYSHSIALKFYILSDRIRPFIGAVASLTKRSYTTEVAEHHRYDPFFYWNERASTAIQGAFVTGAELFITQNFVVGLDLRLYMNIHDLKDEWIKRTHHYYYYTAFETPQALPEEMSWYNLQGFVRFLF